MLRLEIALNENIESKKRLKRKRSCKSTLNINKREKNRDDKKKLGLPPKQQFF